jgi:hypothetical protein
MNNMPNGYPPPQQGPIWPPPPEGMSQQGPYQSPYMPMFRDLAGLRRATIIAIIASTAVWDISDITDVAAPGIVSSTFSTLSLVVYIVSGIIFLNWMYRAYGNLPALAQVRSQSTPGLAVAYFFIPFLSLYKPFQVFQEMWRRSDPNAALPIASQSSGLVTGWWLAYLGMGVTGTVASLLIQSGNSKAIEIGAAVVDDGVTTLAAYLACTVVTLLTVRMLVRYNALAGYVPASVPWQ